MKRPKYIFCFVCLIVSRLISVLFSVYMQLWIMSFWQLGTLSDKEESDAIYRNVIIASQVVTLLTVPAFGYYSDRLDSRVIVPFSFLVRGLVAASFYFITDPRTAYGYIACITIIVLSAMQFISVEVLFLRKMNPHIRGTLSAFAVFFGSFGTTVFTLVGGKVFDSVGPWAPFMIVAGADAAVRLQIKQSWYSH